jgi:hypothetical protein
MCQVGGDPDLVGRAVNQLGNGAVAEQMGPNRLAEGLLGAGFDLLPDGRAAHRPTGANEPEVSPALPTWPFLVCNQSQ